MGVGVVEALALHIGDGWCALDMELAHAEEGADTDGILGGVVGHADEVHGVGVEEHVEARLVEPFALTDAVADTFLPHEGGAGFLDAVDARGVDAEHCLAEGVDVGLFHCFMGLCR